MELYVEDTNTTSNVHQQQRFKTKNFENPFTLTP